MSRTLIAGLIVAVIIVGGGLWLAGSKNDDKTANSTANSSNVTPTPSNNSKTPSTASSGSQQATNKPTDSDGDNDEAAATITYTADGFSPSTVTVKSGDTVAVMNNSGESLQFNSDPHPSHTGNTELNVGSVQSGQTKTFVVTKTGTFGFHNHFNPNHKGSITVQ